MGALIFILALGFFIFLLISIWKVYEKAGRKGWESIIPIYNTWVFAEIVGKPGWMGLLLLIPYVGIIFSIYLLYLLAKSFGKDVLFALGLIFFGFIFFPILAFGDAKYQGPPKDDIMGKIEE